MQFFRWVADNWQAVCGWAAGLYLVYHVGRVFVAVTLAINSISTRFKNAEASLNLLVTNHLPHIQKDIEKGVCLLLDIGEGMKRLLKRERNE